MKKLFYLLFISSVLASCAKPDPIEVNVNVTQDSTFCNCGGATNGTGTSSSSSFVDPNLIGHWKNTTPLVNLGTNDSAQYISNIGDFDIYFSLDGKMHLNHTYEIGSTTVLLGMEYTFDFVDDGILCLSGDNFTTQNNIMHYEINNGVLTYYSEQGLDYFFEARQNFWAASLYFGNPLNVSGYSNHFYLVKTNSLTKQ